MTETTLQLALDGIGPQVQTFALDTPRLHRLATVQQRERLDQTTLVEYADLYREGHDLGPVTVFHEGEEYVLADGFHRVTAALDAGLTTLPAVIHPGGLRDAVLFACGCNLHGVPLSNADKRRRVSTMLQDTDWCTWSDGAIARHCGVTQPFVSKLRASLITVMSDERAAPTTRRYTHRHGQTTTMETAAIGHRPPTEDAPLLVDPGQPPAPGGSAVAGFPAGERASRAGASHPPTAPAPPSVSVTAMANGTAARYADSVEVPAAPGGELASLVRQAQCRLDLLTTFLTTQPLPAAIADHAEICIPLAQACDRLVRLLTTVPEVCNVVCAGPRPSASAPGAAAAPISPRARPTRKQRSVTAATEIQRTAGTRQPERKQHEGRQEVLDAVAKKLNARLAKFFQNAGS